MIIFYFEGARLLRLAAIRLRGLPICFLPACGRRAQIRQAVALLPACRQAGGNARNLPRYVLDGSASHLASIRAALRGFRHAPMRRAGRGYVLDGPACHLASIRRAFCLFCRFGTIFRRNRGFCVCLMRNEKKAFFFRVFPKFARYMRHANGAKPEMPKKLRPHARRIAEN